MKHKLNRYAFPRAHFQMSRASPKMRNFAKRLTAYETRGNEPAETADPAGFSRL